MHTIDWLVLAGFFAYTLWDGIKAHRKSKDVEGLLLGNRNLAWWAIGISVMATQASAITFIGTTGQAFMHDMRFIQVYLGLPLAMIVLSLTLIPLYYYSKAYTAYEILEERFGLRVRLSTSLMFLLSRGAALGIGMAAPAYVLSLILDLPLWLTIMVIGIGTTFYTMFGGINGVIRTDVKQMLLVVIGLIFAFFWIIKKLPESVSFSEALHLAGALGKLETIDLSFNLREKYNIWSGLIAGFFLMFAYFGTDHAQVQRYLTARSLSDARGSIIMSAFAKIPMQFFILLLGACLYVFYIFQDRPLLFIPAETKIYTNECLAKSRELESNFAITHQKREEAALNWLNDRDNQAH
ncbi:MAG: sodium-coupled permease, partial [Bacteroidetes bacterium]|nr:sodium-coupled permease [Bacteroidota bacterium]